MGLHISYCESYEATEKEEDHRYIRLVQQLVEDQIKKPNTLIAACVSAKDDMENQIINTLIRKYDPDGTRTIGVITKVDTIEDGLEDSWVEIVEVTRKNFSYARFILI